MIDHIERQEIIQKLLESEFAPLVEAFLMNENKIYTKKGRLNKSGACRVLDCKTKQLEDSLKQCREILKDDFN